MVGYIRIRKLGYGMSKIKQYRFGQVYNCIKNAGGAGLTVNEISDCVGLAAGGWLKAILQEMVGYGWVRREDVLIETGHGLREAARYFWIERAE